jgi:hypothetical protein
MVRGRGPLTGREPVPFARAGRRPIRPDRLGRFDGLRQRVV